MSTRPHRSCAGTTQKEEDFLEEGGLGLGLGGQRARLEEWGAGVPLAVGTACAKRASGQQVGEGAEKAPLVDLKVGSTVAALVLGAIKATGGCGELGRPVSSAARPA